MQRRSILIAGISLTLAPLAGAQPTAQSELLVFAASSLTNVLESLSSAWERKSGVTVKLSFASSSALARQIEGGARADVFISADQQWMDYLEARALVDRKSRRNVAGNRLVLIAPARSAVSLRIEPGIQLAQALGDGRLACGDPDVVPAGIYARQALSSLGAWQGVENRIARADNVRTALMYVARGEAPLGIVYSTDALQEIKVRVVGTFPLDAHAHIVYPAAATAGASDEARDFVKFLSSQTARSTWEKFGFGKPAR